MLFFFFGLATTTYKYVRITNETHTLVYNDPQTALPLEISLMLKLQGERGSASQGAAVLLLDWFILDKELILVQERPVPSTDLLRYMKTKGGLLEEQEAKVSGWMWVQFSFHVA